MLRYDRSTNNRGGKGGEKHKHKDDWKTSATRESTGIQITPQ